MSDMDKLRAALSDVEAGTRIPYLGAGVAALNKGDAPTSPEALCAKIESEVRVPKRASGNLWSAAQYVESRKFRATLNDIVTRAFLGDEGGNPVHEWLARVRPPLVVDSWYDDGLLNAYGSNGSGDWGWVQGWSRNGEWIEIWTKAFTPEGEMLEDPIASWESLVYKPHGLARKGSSFLLSDSDYVEVLTEIDIQTPIPVEVRDRRTSRNFLFLGCRFDDQMLRIFARQIVKRSAGKHLAVIPGELTRMEAKFLEEVGIERLDLPVEAVLEAIETVAA